MYIGFMNLSPQPREGGWEGGCRWECGGQFDEAVGFFIAGDVGVTGNPVDCNGVPLTEEVCGCGVYGTGEFLSRSSCESGGPQDGGLVVRKNVHCASLQVVKADVFPACLQAFVDGSEFCVEDFGGSLPRYHGSYVAWYAVWYVVTGTGDTL
jgi:hypothetical protein